MNDGVDARQDGSRVLPATLPGSEQCNIDFKFPTAILWRIDCRHWTGLCYAGPQLLSLELLASQNGMHDV